MSFQEEDLPVLNAVVESGNRSIIQSTRMGNEVLRELESLRQDAARSLHMDVNLDTEETQHDPEVTSESDTLSADSTLRINETRFEVPVGLDFSALSSSDEGIQEDELELMIDEIVDRHITALRRDIRDLLERARKSP